MAHPVEYKGRGGTSHGCSYQRRADAYVDARLHVVAIAPLVWSSAPLALHRFDWEAWRRPYLFIDMRVRNLLPSLLAVPLLVSAIGVTPAIAVTLNLRDVPVGDSDREAIEFLNTHDVIYGAPDGTFRPDASISRGEILKIALEAGGFGTRALGTSGTQIYTDVPPSHTLGGYITVAAGAGHISGYGDGTFRPDAQVTRAEAAKIVANVLGAPAGASSDYTDVADSSLAPFIGRLAAANWYRPAAPTYNPNIPVTRREVARMTYRALVATAADPARVYRDGMPEPTGVASDWDHYRDGVVPFDAPAGWFSVTDVAEEDGITFDVVIVGLEDADMPAFALARVDMTSLVDLFTRGIQAFTDASNLPDPTVREIAVGPSQQLVRVLELEIDDEEPATMLAWVTEDSINYAFYFHSDAPGLRGVFDRFVQHAMELSGAVSFPS